MMPIMLPFSLSDAASSGDRGIAQKMRHFHGTLPKISRQKRIALQLGRMYDML